MYLRVYLISTVGLSLDNEYNTMLRTFLNNKANITRSSVSNTDWIDKIVEQLVYFDIWCYYYATRGWYEDTNIWVNTKQDTMTVIIEWDKTAVRLWDHIEISDPDMWLIGKYEIIVPPKANRLHNGTIDSIQFSVKAI